MISPVSVNVCCYCNAVTCKIHSINITNDKEHRITDTQFKKHRSYMGETEIAYISSIALGLYLGNVWFVPQAGHAAT